VATYAIGDVQGCYDSLMKLIDALPLGDDDQLWLVGDLVNRGPRSTEVLRWVKAQGERCVTVLGNHDLHLLTMAAGTRRAKDRDTAQEVLSASDADELIDWLRHRPLAHRRGSWLMVHAGIHPSWTADDAMSCAAELEQVLRADDWKHTIDSLRSKAGTTSWLPTLGGKKRRRAALSILTRMRCLRRADGTWILDHDFVGRPDQAPDGLIPWFDAPHTERSVRVVFGHWAALGVVVRDDIVAVDSGCVWGNALTAVRLDDDCIFTQPAIDQGSP